MLILVACLKNSIYNIIHIDMMGSLGSSSLYLYVIHYILHSFIHSYLIYVLHDSDR